MFKVTPLKVKGFYTIFSYERDKSINWTINTVDLEDVYYFLEGRVDETDLKDAILILRDSTMPQTFRDDGTLIHVASPITA